MSIMEDEDEDEVLETIRSNDWTEVEYRRHPSRECFTACKNQIPVLSFAELNLLGLGSSKIFSDTWCRRVVYDDNVCT